MEKCLVCGNLEEVKTYDVVVAAGSILKNPHLGPC